MVRWSLNGTFLPFGACLNFDAIRWSVPKPQKHDFSLNLSRVIEPKGGPGVEFANLEDAARVQPSGLQRMM
jgi:hypothetical protein